jgi:hypothetical protein
VTVGTSLPVPTCKNCWNSNIYSTHTLIYEDTRILLATTDGSVPTVGSIYHSSFTATRYLLFPGWNLMGGLMVATLQETIGNAIITD